mgnify:FL=1
MKTVALAFVERAKTPPHSCKRRIPMKKLFLSVLAIALMLTSFTLVSSAGEAYTIPQCAVPPTIDGKMSKNEWYGAYHKFMNNEKGNYDYSDNPSPDVEDKANQCKGFDIYMYWYDDPNESGKLLDVKKGGLYICVVAQDKTYGTIFNDGEASNASDCFQLAIDPFNYRLSNSKKAFIFDFSPETTKKGTALIFEHYQFKSKPLTMFKYQVKAKRDKNGYTMEIFIPWSLLNLNDKLPRHKVGAKMGIGIICMDWVGARYYYDIADFGNGKKIVDIAGVPKLYNQVTFGETVYPPGYKSDSDLTKLNELIKKAEEVEKNKAEYLEATYSAFELALKEAKAVKAEDKQATVDAAYKKLDDAIKNLKKSADMTPFEALQAAITAANEFVEEDYHAQTWEAFAKALDSAKKLTEKSSKEDIAAATEALNTAIKGLVPADQELTEVDFTQLEAKIAQVEGLNEADYTAESWAKLKEVYDKAKDIDGKADAVQTDVDDLVKKLNDAISALVKAGEQQSSTAADNTPAAKTSSLLWLWIVIAVAVFAAAAIIIIIRSKKEKNNI